MAGACGGDSSFDGRVRFLARLDAGKEIRHVVDRSVAEALLTENGILPGLQALAVNTEAVAIDFQRGLGAAKLKAAVVNGGAHHALVHHIPPG